MATFNKGKKNKKFGEPLEVGRGGANFVSGSKPSGGSWVDGLPLNPNASGVAKGRTPLGKAVKGSGCSPKDPTKN